MPNSEDTEITLGTGKMLAIFFGLVALCAVFFGMGFSLGKSSAAPTSMQANSTAGSPRPATVKPSGSAASPDLSFYKTVGQKEADAALPAAAAPVADANGAPSQSQPGAPDPAAAPPLNGYYVQVAAVSKEEDAQALVEALKKKQYAAFATSLQTDKLFHVQIGPFADIKEAEGTRAKLVGDGYNPILKK
jgi:DedD protein